ncbi:MAG: hypothetical protein MUE41_08940, partial [Gemmatimonadaceae bacterium]|nr:hypothetical protein [Gemmatimonadaceae bacterium]
MRSVIAITGHRAVRARGRNGPNHARTEWRTHRTHTRDASNARLSWHRRALDYLHLALTPSSAHDCRIR